jgi:hypothetical protein
LVWAPDCPTRSQQADYLLPVRTSALLTLNRLSTEPEARVDGVLFLVTDAVAGA